MAIFIIVSEISPVHGFRVRIYQHTCSLMHALVSTSHFSMVYNHSSL